MPNDIVESYVEVSAGKLDWAMPFQRTGKFPLDRSTMFDSYADAVKYAAGNVNDPDKRALCGTSYVGQVISVFENGVVSVYKIAADRTLGEVGSATAGDGKSIVLDGSILKIKGFDTATAGQMIRVANKGTAEEPQLELEFYTPSTDEVEGLRAEITKLLGDENVDGSVDNKIKTFETEVLKKNYYDKDAIDGKLTSAMNYQGSKESFAELEQAVADGTITPKKGDVWNIKTAGGVDADGVAIKAGSNVAFNGTGWDVNDGIQDMSGFYDKTAADETFVAKEAGKTLISTDELTRLGDIEKVEGSETNGHIKIGETDVKVYDLPTATKETLGGVKSSEGDNAVVVAEDGTMQVTSVAGSTVSGAVDEAKKLSHSLKIGEKEFDGTNPVEIEASDIPLPTDVVKNTNYGTAAVGGVVKGSDADNQVAIGVDGTMTVNAVTGEKVKGSVDSAKKTDHTLIIGTKTFDGSTDTEIKAEDLPLPSDLVKTSDIASGTKVGVVKGSTDKDKVAVEADGTMSLNTISGSKVDGTVSKATDAAKLGGVAATDILVADAESNPTAKVKHASAADQLSTPHAISVTGDASGSANFDGSADAEINLKLSETLEAAGTFTKVTVDKTGRVTKGENLNASDIPDITLEKVTDAGKLAAKDKIARTDLTTELEANIADVESKAHEHQNRTVLDGISSAKVAGWDAAAGAIDGKADKATTLAGYGITDAYTKTEADGRFGGALHLQGSKDTYQILLDEIAAGTIVPKQGDVWNIKSAGGVDAHGNEIKAGDDIGCFDATPGDVKFDVLSGVQDLSAYALNDSVNTELAKKADKTVVEDISDRVDTMETTVGDATAGLVKDVADLKTAKTNIDNEIAGIKTDIGVPHADDDGTGVPQNATGMHKSIEDLRKDVDTLKDTADNPDSVRGIIAATTDDIIAAAAEKFSEEGGLLDQTVNEHNTDPDAHTDFFAAKQNKIIETKIAISVEDFVATDDTEPGNYKAVIAVPGVDADRKYKLDLVAILTKENHAAIVAAGFLPMNKYNVGNVTVYCATVPTVDFDASVTCTEIQ